MARTRGAGQMTLGLYLTRILGLRIAGAAAVLLALGLGLDLLRASDELMAFGGAPALAAYAALRAPAVAAQMLPIAVLVGALAAFLALSARSEITVMRAAGQSVFALLRRLAPLALALGVANHLLVDRGAAWSARALGEAFAGVGAAAEAVRGERLIARLPGLVVTGRVAREDGQALAPFAVFALDARGLVTGRVEAAAALRVADAWTMIGARRVGETGTAATRWRSALDPSTVRAIAGGGAEATARDAAAALAGLALATSGPAYYRTRLARARAAFVAPAVMLVLATLASFGGARLGSAAKMATLGAALGFGFLALDGVLAALGRIALLSAPIAAWTAPALFACVGVWALLMTEE